MKNLNGIAKETLVQDKQRKQVQIGDILSIPFSADRKAFAHVLFCETQSPDSLGYMIRVFDIVSNESVPVEIITKAGNMFPPVFVGLQAAISSGRWKILSNWPVKDFVFPKFRSTFGTRPGVYHDWKIWDGTERVVIGDLPPELRSLELESVWGAEGLEERIARGGSYRGNEMY